MNNFRIVFFNHVYKLLRSCAIRILPKEVVQPRAFSNAKLRAYASVFKGSVVNVSGWDDRDGEGSHYRDYFTGHTAYTVTNAPLDDKGFGSMEGKDAQERTLDLTDPLPSDLIEAFDVVFNHTTLEHIFDIDTAFKNLCLMSRDAVIIIVPVLQQLHVTKSFGDYWRPTTITLAKQFTKNGFTPLVIATNDQPFFPIYCFAIGVRNPKKYEGIIKSSLNFEMGAVLFGSSLKFPAEPFTTSP